MQLLPDARSSRLTAVLLLVIAVLLVYLLVFHWFVLAHAAYEEELTTQRETLGRFQAVAAQSEALEERLRELRNTREDTGLFLAEGDFNEAAAAMADRLGQMVRTQAGDECQIVSRQPVRPRVQERFQRVTVNVRMRCGIEDLMLILHQLEAETPMVLVDDVNIVRPRTRRRVAGRIEEVAGVLDVRFNMSGYLAAAP